MRNRKLGRKRWIIPPMIIFLMVTLAVIVITALLAPVIAPIDLGASDLTQRLKMPKFKDPTSPYLFGTDNLGRDVAIRLLYATRSTIMISFTGMIIATVTGTALGILSGLGGKWIDAVLSFFTDVRLSIPTTFIGIIFACILGGKAGYDNSRYGNHRMVFLLPSGKKPDFSAKKCEVYRSEPFYGGKRSKNCV